MQLKLSNFGIKIFCYLVVEAYQRIRKHNKLSKNLLRIFIIKIIFQIQIFNKLSMN